MGQQEQLKAVAEAPLAPAPFWLLKRTDAPLVAVIAAAAAAREG